MKNLRTLVPKKHAKLFVSSNDYDEEGDDMEIEIEEEGTKNMWSP